MGWLLIRCIQSIDSIVNSLMLFYIHDMIPILVKANNM